MASVTVASIYPIAVVERRSQNQPQNEYALRACPPGEVVTFEVLDAEFSQYMGYGKSALRTTRAIDIANDIVRCFTRNFPGTFNPDICRPGIWVCAGPKPTKREQDQNEEVQNEFCRESVREADRFSAKNRPDLITRRHLVLADWIGVKGRPWQERLDRSAKEACPFCGSQNPSYASVCATCRNVLNEERYKAIQTAIREGRNDEVRSAVQAAQNGTSIDLAAADVDELMKDLATKKG
ncbi:MAG: hypothetical protein QM757_26420 [Paludibaculum sp.]